MTTPTTVQVRLQIRADTAANWTSVNPILLTNELGLESDTKKFKIGNGTSAWVDLAYFPSIVSGGTVLGNLEIGTTGTLTFEGSTANGFETTLGVVDPTADRTILLPNQSGTVVVGGNASIVDADIAANAEIAVSKLADGAARQLLQTDAAGTGVEWTSNIDIPGTLDVTGVATFDNAVTIAGDLTVNGTTTNINTQNLVVEDKNIILADVATPTDVTADGGGITLKGATDKTINWIDSTDAWTSSERFSVPLGSAAAPSLTFTSDENTGIYSPGADQVAISTNSAGRLFIDASGNVSVGSSAAAGGGGVGLALYNSSVPILTFRNSTTGDTGSDGTHFYASGSDFEINNKEAGYLGFRTSNLERLRITSAGLVGVGTSNPQALLDITDTGNQPKLRLSTNTASNFLEISRSSSTGNYTFASEENGSSIIFATDPDGTGAQNRVTIDRYGKVGIGTSTPQHLFDCAGAGRFTGNATGGSTGSGLEVGYDSGSNSGFIQSFNRATSGYLGTFIDGANVRFQIGGNEAARIDSARRLLVGTSSSVGNGSAVQVIGPNAVEVFRYSAPTGNSGPSISLTRSASNTVGTVAAVAATDDLGQVTFRGAGNGTTFIEGASIRATVESGTVSGSSLPTRLVFSTTPDSGSSPQERMRIRNDGEVLINKTSSFGVVHSLGVFKSNQALGVGTDAGTGQEAVRFYNGATAVGTIATSASATSYNTSSDYRLKENVTAVTDGITRLQQLKPSRFNFIADPTKTVDGFLAHEAAEVVPECVTGEKDAVDDEGNPKYQGIDQSKLVPLLTAALQEAVAKIESLEARLTAAGI